MRLLLDFEMGGEWPPATSGVADTSGAENVLVDAGDVGAGKILQVAYVKVRNKSETGTTVRIIDSDENEIFADYLNGGEAFIYAIPRELDEGVGLHLDLDGANEHHWSVLSRVRDA